MGRQSTLSDPSDAWRLDMKMSGGGALADVGVYGINAVALPAERGTRRGACLGEDRPRRSALQDRGGRRLLAVPLPSGTIANGTTSFSCAGTMAYQVFCENGRLVADPGCFYGGNKLSLIGVPAAQGAPKITEIDQFEREMDWMADVVRGKVPLVTPGEEGLQDVRLMTAILESVAKRRRDGEDRLGLQARSMIRRRVVDLPEAGLSSRRAISAASFSPRQTRSACTVSATSWTRSNCMPVSMPFSASAIEPPSR